jgi:hypothetical protein
VSRGLQHPEDHCLVLSKVGLRAQVHVTDALKFITKLLDSMGLTLDADRPSTEPQVVWKINGRVGPVRWKVVFGSAKAASTVLRRWSCPSTSNNGSTSECST